MNQGQAQDQRPRGFARLFSYDHARAGRGPLLFAFLILIPLVGGFGAWAALAPLNAAAIAPGEIVLTTDRKTVQHLEGGIVTDILVGEGQSVAAGAPLLIIQDLEARARIDALDAQLLGVRAEIARLSAERDGLETPSFDQVGAGLEKPKRAISQAAATHQAIFDNLVSSIRMREDLAASRTIQIRREIEGLSAQVASAERQLELLEQELAASAALMAKGLSTEKQHIQLQKDQARIEGEIGAFAANIAKLEQSILDQELETFQIKTDRRTTLLNELQATEIRAAEIGVELKTLRDQRQRSTVRAPVDGRVLGLAIQTVGAVLSPGTMLMEIVPETDDLTVEAKVSPIDIDLVEDGMTAEIQLSSYSQRRAPRITARLQSIAGDRLVDEATGQAYFLARLKVDEHDLAELPEDVSLTPGMPADVFLIAGERTVADYLIAPIANAAFRAFRED